MYMTDLQVHSFIWAISIAPLQVHYYSEALPTARILWRSFTPKCQRKLRVKDFPKVPTWRLERDFAVELAYNSSVTYKPSWSPLAFMQVKIPRDTTRPNCGLLPLVPWIYHPVQQQHSSRSCSLALNLTLFKHLFYTSIHQIRITWKGLCTGLLIWDGPFLARLNGPPSWGLYGP